MLNTIHTSYFAKLAKIDTEKYAPINIAGKQPDGVNLPTCKALVPPKQLVFDYKNGKIKWPEYVFVYNDMLDRHVVIDVVKEIEALAEGKIPVLICYERPQANCHRHLAVWWIKASYNLTTSELEDFNA